MTMEPVPGVRERSDDQVVAGQDPVFGNAIALDHDKECRRRTLYEMVVEAKKSVSKVMRLGPICGRGA